MSQAYTSDLSQSPRLLNQGYPVPVSRAINLSRAKAFLCTLNLKLPNPKAT
jgi:hypothetical protein